MKASALFYIPLFGLALAAPATPQDQCSVETSNIFQQVSSPDGSGVQVKGCDIAIPQSSIEANGLDKRAMHGTLQVMWTITLSTAQDIIIRALVNMVNDQVTLFTEMAGMGVTVDNVARLSGTQVAFEVNAAGRWGDTAARFVYDFGVGTIITFIREGARDPRGYNLPVDTQYCYTRPA
ncbi:hypothetical protein JMJ77_0008354 [Colletotrichum scovillei]|uniref:Uncharacterized protein n=4 Tax=Colletotrichum acutatum species complex TaxID=2707335 RepID=A0A9P7RFU0_9PEZI|nr:hypothetical protein JMJ77_0008354 [Colletotrichum scovillei]KAG7075275.1 hypothetical protein JMJ76_0011736 [Colletotrichum scovillei]KAG7082491.1 hypothetical protein JMJ78_0004592 [Colletotrichum scovillei]